MPYHHDKSPSNHLRCAFMECHTPLRFSGRERQLVSASGLVMVNLTLFSVRHIWKFQTQGGVSCVFSHAIPISVWEFVCLFNHRSTLTLQQSLLHIPFVGPPSKLLQTNVCLEKPRKNPRVFGGNGAWPMKSFNPASISGSTLLGLGRHLWNLGELVGDFTASPNK